jgi:hypothetical protein
MGMDTSNIIKQKRIDRKNEDKNTTKWEKTYACTSPHSHEVIRFDRVKLEVGIRLIRRKTNPAENRCHKERAIR